MKSMRNKRGGAHGFHEAFESSLNKPVSVITGYNEDKMGSPYPSAVMSGGRKRRSRSSSSSRKTKTTKKKTTRRRRSMRGGSSVTGMESVTGLGSSVFSNSAPISAESQKNTIPLETIATPDWTNPGQKPGPPPYAASSSVGWNEYQFGRTTPDNKFVVATGLVPGKNSLEMIGAGKKKRSRSKSIISKSANTIKKTGKVVFNKTKSVVTTVGDIVVKTVQYIGKKTKNTVSSLSSKKKKSKKSKKSKKTSRK
jgi:hypothetical protein